MADQENTPTLGGMQVDRAAPIGLSKILGRFALHVFIKNPDPIDVTATVQTGATVWNSVIGAEKTVGTTAVRVSVGASNAADRAGVYIENTSDEVLFYGPSGVTTSGSTRGARLFPNGHVFLGPSDTGDLFIISGVAAKTFLVQEFII